MAGPIDYLAGRIGDLQGEIDKLQRSLGESVAAVAAQAPRIERLITQLDLALEAAETAAQAVQERRDPPGQSHRPTRALVATSRVEMLEDVVVEVRNSLRHLEEIEHTTTCMFSAATRLQFGAIEQQLAKIAGQQVTLFHIGKREIGLKIAVISGLVLNAALWLINTFLWT